MPCAGWRSSRATRSARWTRSAPPAAPSAELDRLLEHDLALERPVNRALRGDLGEALALLLGELLREAHRHRELGRRAALGRLVVHVDLHVADVPALALGVHLDRDRGAGGEAHGEHLLRVRAAVGAAVRLRLVDGQLVLADAHGVLEALVAYPLSVRLHDLPPNNCGLGSSV